jgi:hypothetical protein
MSGALAGTDDGDAIGGAAQRTASRASKHLHRRLMPVDAGCDQ